MNSYISKKKTNKKTKQEKKIYIINPNKCKHTKIEMNTQEEIREWQNEDSQRCFCFCFFLKLIFDRQNNEHKKKIGQIQTKQKCKKKYIIHKKREKKTDYILSFFVLHSF